MLIKYTGKYVNIYFIMKIKFLSLCRICFVFITCGKTWYIRDCRERGKNVMYEREFSPISNPVPDVNFFS